MANKKDSNAANSTNAAVNSAASNGNGANTATTSSSNSLPFSDMTLGSDYFAVGSVVRCQMCNNSVVEGEVMGFDPTSRIIILKGAPSNKRASCNDVFGLNLNLASDVKVITEVKDAPKTSASTEPAALSVAKLNSRVQSSLDRKKRLIKAFKVGVSPEGQRLFQAISKTIDEIEWDGENIIIMSKVTVVPPYKLDNVKGVSDSKAVLHVRKIVEKHYADLKSGNNDSNTTTTPITTATATTTNASSPSATSSSGTNRTASPNTSNAANTTASSTTNSSSGTSSKTTSPTTATAAPLKGAAAAAGSNKNSPSPPTTSSSSASSAKSSSPPTTATTTMTSSSANRGAPSSRGGGQSAGTTRGGSSSRGGSSNRGGGGSGSGSGSGSGGPKPAYPWRSFVSVVRGDTIGRY